MSMSTPSASFDIPYHPLKAESEKESHIDFVDIVLDVRDATNTHDPHDRGIVVTNNGWVIMPHNRFLQIHETLEFLAMIYIAIVAPFEIAFRYFPTVESPVFWLEALIDLHFLLDIYVNFHAAYVDFSNIREGELVHDPARIRNHYLRTWFLPDVLSILPLHYIYLLITGDFTDPFKICKLFRLSRLWKTYASRSGSKKVSRLEMTSPILFQARHLVKLLGWIMYSAHVFGCAWFYLGTINENHQYSGWVKEEDLDKDDLVRCYITSVYWAYTTMATVGYGDIVGRTNYERAFSILTFIAGGLVFGFMVGSVTDIIRRASAASSRYVEIMSEKYEYLRFMEVPTPLIKKITGYYEHLYKGGTVFNEKMILEDLPKSIRTELAQYLYHDILMGVPLFSDCTERELTALCLHFRSVHAAAGDMLAMEDDEVEDLYIVRRGTVVLQRGGTVLRQLRRSDFFGEQALLTHEIMPVSAMALTHCEFCCLSKADLRAVTETHPELSLKLRKLAREWSAYTLRESLAIRDSKVDREILAKSQSNTHNQRPSLSQAGQARPFQAAWHEMDAPTPDTKLSHETFPIYDSNEILQLLRVLTEDSRTMKNEMLRLSAEIGLLRTEVKERTTGR